MNKIKVVGLLVVLVLFCAQFCIGQENAIIPDLAKIGAGEGWKIANREVKVIKEDDQLSVYFEAQAGDGVAWLENLEVTDGIIEADIKGKDLSGRSFVGIAFRGVDEETYDAVYFRPFNFMSDDSLRKGHSVQYISHPDYSWPRLRNEHPGKYENPVNPAPDPNSFFHAKIVIQKPIISVYVNDAREPCLVVEELSERNGGRVGLWTGNYSDGTFANLKIIPAKDQSN